MNKAHLAESIKWADGTPITWRFSVSAFKRDPKVKCWILWEEADALAWRYGFTPPPLPGIGLLSDA